MKEHCLKALWLCLCVQACLMLGVWSRKWAGGVGVLGGVEISLVANVLVAAVNAQSCKISLENTFK